MKHDAAAESDSENVYLYVSKVTYIETHGNKSNEQRLQDKDEVTTLHVLLNVLWGQIFCQNYLNVVTCKSDGIPISRNVQFPVLHDSSLTKASERIGVIVLNLCLEKLCQLLVHVVLTILVNHNVVDILNPLQNLILVM